MFILFYSIANERSALATSYRHFSLYIIRSTYGCFTGLSRIYSQLHEYQTYATRVRTKIGLESAFWSTCTGI